MNQIYFNRKMPKTLLTNSLAILPMTPGDQILHNHEILLDDGKIEAIQPAGTTKPENATTINTKHGIILPGLVNAHAHLPMSFFRGICHSRPEILYEVVYPIEKHLTPQEIYPLTMLGLLETTRAGVTCTGDHYFFEEEVAKAVTDAGVRGVLGETISTYGGSLSSKDSLSKGLDFASAWKQKNKLIRTILSPHASDTVDPEWFKAIINASEKEHLGIHLHLAQSRREVSFVESKYGKTPVQHVADLGVLGPRTLAAHCIHVNNNDIEILAKYKTNIGHCPASQLLFEQLAPLHEFIKSGISIAIATDASCSNDDMDLLKELRITALAHSARSGTPHMFKAMELLKMATINGAKAIGVEKEIGTLEAGKRGDIIVIRTDSPRMNPLHDIPNTIVFSASTDEVDIVMVDGEIRYSRELGWPGINAQEIINEANRATELLCKKAQKEDPKIKDLFESRYWGQTSL